MSGLSVKIVDDDKEFKHMIRSSLKRGWGGRFYSVCDHLTEVLPVTLSDQPMSAAGTSKQHWTSKEGKERSVPHTSCHTCGEDLFCLNAPHTHRWFQLFWLIRPLLRLQIYLYENKITFPVACCVCCIAYWCAFPFLDLFHFEDGNL